MIPAGSQSLEEAAARGSFTEPGGRDVRCEPVLAAGPLVPSGARPGCWPQRGLCPARKSQLAVLRHVRLSRALSRGCVCVGRSGFRAGAARGRRQSRGMQAEKPRRAHASGRFVRNRNGIII